MSLLTYGHHDPAMLTLSVLMAIFSARMGLQIARSARYVARSGPLAQRKDGDGDGVVAKVRKMEVLHRTAATRARWRSGRQS